MRRTSSPFTLLSLQTKKSHILDYSMFLSCLEAKGMVQFKKEQKDIFFIFFLQITGKWRCLNHEKIIKWYVKCIQYVDQYSIHYNGVWTEERKRLVLKNTKDRNNEVPEDEKNWILENWCRLTRNLQTEWLQHVKAEQFLGYNIDVN